MNRVGTAKTCTSNRTTLCLWTCTYSPAALLIVVAALGGAGGCSGGFINADSPVALGAFDPELINKAQTLIVSFSTTKTCKDIVDKSPTEIQGLLEPEGAPLQILTPDRDEHVFGKVPPDAPIAYFVLASASQSTNQRVEFDQFQGSVFAVGCRDFSAPSGTRHDLPLTLFPTGLR